MEIKIGDPNSVIDGKGYININLTGEPHPSPERSGRGAKLNINLRTMTDKNLERDICPKCLKTILANI